VCGCLRSRCGVASSTPYRAVSRMRAENPEFFGSLSASFEAFLRDQPGIRDVRLNPSWQSLILHYDPDLLDANRLVTLIEQRSLDQIRAYPPRHHPQSIEE
jgi:hypothetical protein